MDVIAHRGASAERPENTLAAFERALAIGVDGIETDLLLTKDGRLVARHDDLIETDHGVCYVRELTFSELQAIDVGDGERVPSVELVLERLAGRCPLVLDLKCPGIAPVLAGLLRARGVAAGVHVTSCLPEELVQMGRLVPGVERSLTLAAPLPQVARLCRELGVRTVSLGRSSVTEPLVRRLRQERLGVRAYTVNVPREAASFAAWGVAAIYTDDPAAMQALRARG